MIILLIINPTEQWLNPNRFTIVEMALVLLRPSSRSEKMASIVCTRSNKLQGEGVTESKRNWPASFNVEASE
jgi:hypothetical protein